MRHLVLLLIGLAVGALATASIVNALRQREAYPRGLMNVLQHHYAALREDVRRNRCAQASSSDLAVLRLLAQEIGSAEYAGKTPDTPFPEYEQRLRDALATTPANCGDAHAALERISAACEACHQQYR